MKALLHLPLILLTLAIPSIAQDEKAKAEPVFYRLDFVVKEVESGKVVNSRNYTSMVSPSGDRSSGSIRAGNRVPITSASPTAPGLPTQYTFYDAGINIDFSNPKELTDRLALLVSADISSLPAAPETPGLPPITRQTRWTSYVVVSLRKPTTIFTSDDPASKRQLQLELTATPIK